MAPLYHQNNKPIPMALYIIHQQHPSAQAMPGIHLDLGNVRLLITSDNSELNESPEPTQGIAKDPDVSPGASGTDS